MLNSTTVICLYYSVLFDRKCLVQSLLPNIFININIVIVQKSHFSTEVMNKREAAASRFRSSGLCPFGRSFTGCTRGKFSNGLIAAMVMAL